MLEIHYIRENKEAVIQGLQKRKLPGACASVEHLLILDQQRRATQVALEQATAVVKQRSQQQKRGVSPLALADLPPDTSLLKQEIKELTHRFKACEEALQQALYALPNLPHAAVPVGDSAAHNVVVYQTNPLPVVDNKRPHWELGHQYAIIDFALGNQLTGAGFPVYRGKGAILQRALINFFLEEARQVGYEEIQPPLLVNATSAYGTGQLPDKEGQMYQLADPVFYLIPTAEVPLTNLYRNQILYPKDLPIKHVAYTPCFRREAGSWGSHVRGLNRLHQFDKVELVQLSLPEHSDEALQQMCMYVEKLLQKLELPYRILKLCSGDLGFTAAMTYDMEVFAAAQGRWLEVSSISNFATYQAQRMKIRYRTTPTTTRLVHTLNGSALALPRIMAALLENNQTAQTISIPAVLQPYTGFSCIP